MKILFFFLDGGILFCPSIHVYSITYKYTIPHTINTFVKAHKHGHFPKRSSHARRTSMLSFSLSPFIYPHEHQPIISIPSLPLHHLLHIITPPPHLTPPHPKPHRMEMINRPVTPPQIHFQLDARPDRRLDVPHRLLYRVRHHIVHVLGGGLSGG